MTTVDSTMNNSPVDTKRESVVVWTFDSRPAATTDSVASKASHQQKTSDQSDELNTSPSNQVAKTSSEALPILKALKLSIERGISIKHNDGMQPNSQTASQSRDESQHSQNGLQTNGALHDEEQSSKEPELHTNDREYRDSKDAEQSKQDALSKQDSGYDTSHANGEHYSKDNGRPLRGASHHSPARSDGISRRRPSYDRDSLKESRHTLRETDTCRPGVDTHRPDRPAHKSTNNQTEAGNTVEKLSYVANGANQGHNDTSRPSRASDYRGQSVPTQDYRRLSLDQVRGTRYSPYSGQASHRSYDNGSNNRSSSASRDRPYIANVSRDQAPSSFQLPLRASADYRGHERFSGHRKSTEIDHTRYHDSYATQRDYRERDYYATTRPHLPLYEYNRRSEARYHERYPPAGTVAPAGYHNRPADPYVVDQPSRVYSYPERRVDPVYERRDYPADYSREVSGRYEGRAYAGNWNHQAGDHRRDYRDTPSQSASAYSDRRYDYGPYDARAPPAPLTPAGYDTRYQSRYDYR